MKIFQLVPLMLTIVALTGAGCLKTRAQLKNEPNEETPAANPIQDVPPTAGPAMSSGGGYAVDELKAEIARLTGRVDELERGTRGGTDSVKSLETRIAELEKAQADMIVAFKKSEIQAAEPADLLAAARERFAAENYDGAIEVLTPFLNNAKGKNNSEAVFLRAESYYATKQYKKAIADYSRFPESFTKSRRMPQALYKIGLSFDALGMKTDAAPFYQELSEKFPNSAEAKKARARKK